MNRLTWQHIRAMWVNGECEEARIALVESDGFELYNVLLEAVETSMKLKHQSGDLTDLREILKSLTEIHSV